MPLLPPIGAEIPCSMLALDAKVEYEGKTLALDFRGGIKQRVDVNPDDPINSVRMRTVGFKMSAEGDGLVVALEQNDVDTEAPSRLRISQSFPPKFEQRDVLTFAVEFVKEEGEPVILVTKKPMVMIGDLTQYPPKGDSYRLEAPVELMTTDGRDRVVGRITAFSYKKGGL